MQHHQVPLSEHTCVWHVASLQLTSIVDQDFEGLPLSPEPMTLFFSKTSHRLQVGQVKPTRTDQRIRVSCWHRYSVLPPVLQCCLLIGSIALWCCTLSKCTSLADHAAQDLSWQHHKPPYSCRTDRPRVSLSHQAALRRLKEAGPSASAAGACQGHHRVEHCAALT